MLRLRLNLIRNLQTIAAPPNRQALFSPPDSQSTLVPEQPSALEEEGVDEAPLIRLASFPEISPSPMLEINRGWGIDLS